jgi:hypothetical protein
MVDIEYSRRLLVFVVFVFSLLYVLQLMMMRRCLFVYTDDRKPIAWLYVALDAFKTQESY